MVTSHSQDRPFSPGQPATVPGISGKQVTGWVVAALAVIGVVLSYTLWTYNRLDDARRVSVAEWREVTEHLSERYRIAERTVAAGVDDRTLRMEDGEQFRLALDTFRTTSLPEKQFAAAARVEEILARQELSAAAAQLNLSDGGRDAVESFNQAKEFERALLESWGGRFLDIFLKFDLPRRFVLAGETSNN